MKNTMLCVILLAACTGVGSSRGGATDPHPFRMAGAVVSQDSSVPEARLILFGESRALCIELAATENRNFVLLDVGTKKWGDSIADHWNPATDALMINGGYFTWRFAPVGYCKVDDKEITREVSPKLSGFVALDRTGAVALLTRDECDALGDYPTVFQCGPYVLDPGGRIGIRDQEGPAARRTVLARAKDGRLWIIVVPDPISLYHLAEMLKVQFPDMDRALNLDGGHSTAIRTATDEIRNATPVRTYLVKRKSMLVQPSSGPNER